MKKIKREQIILFIALFVLLIPYIVIGFFSRPCADDWSNSYLIYNYIKNNGFNLIELLKLVVSHVKKVYFTWQGTYSSVFIMALQPSILSEKYYFLGSFLLIIFTLLTFCYFYKVLLNEKRITLFLSIITTLFIYGNMPCLVQGLYWFNGTYHYIPFFLLTMWNFSLLIRYHQTQKKHLILIAVILSSIISGGNQVTGFLNILILLFIFIYDIYEKNIKLSCLPFVSAVIFFLIMAFAPGNMIRKSNFPSHSVFSTMFNSVLGGYMFFCEWFNIGLICFIVLNLIFIIIFNKKIIEMYKVKIHPLIVFVISIIFYCGVLCVPFYAMGSFGDGRTKNAIWLTFTFCLVISIDYLFIYVIKKEKNKLINNFINKNLSFVIICILTLIISIQPNYMRLINDLAKGHAYKYAEVYDNNIKILQKAPNDSIVELKPLPSCVTLKFNDITNDPDD